MSQRDYDPRLHHAAVQVLINAPQVLEDVECTEQQYAGGTRGEKYLHSSGMHR